MSVTKETYALPPNYFYVDAPSAKQFDDNTGVEVVARVTLAASRDASLDTWIQSIWRPGAETLVPADGRAHVGEERLMQALGIQEKLLAAGLPIDDDYAVPSILYVVTNPGKVPIANKLAFVRFLRVDDATTDVVWSIKVTPTPAMDAPTLAGLVAKMLERGVAALAAGAETAKL